MKRSTFSDDKILKIVREREAGRKVADLCRTHGIGGAPGRAPSSRWSRSRNHDLTARVRLAPSPVVIDNSCRQRRLIDRERHVVARREMLLRARNNMALQADEGRNVDRRRRCRNLHPPHQHEHRRRDRVHARAAGWCGHSCSFGRFRGSDTETLNRRRPSHKPSGPRAPLPSFGDAQPSHEKRQLRSARAADVVSDLGINLRSRSRTESGCSVHPRGP